MTYDDAVTITGLLIDAFPADRAWEPEEIRAYAHGIEHLDAEVATLTVTRAQSTLDRRPPVHAFTSIYRSVRADRLARERGVTEPTQPHAKKSLPAWVGEWACARYFYAKFGREQDLRRFAQQGDWADPAVPLMPPGEWATEAKAIRGRDIYRVLGR